VVVSVFLYLLYFPSYDVINDVIMSYAVCTPGREPKNIKQEICIALYYNVCDKALRLARVNEGSHSFTCHPHVYVNFAGKK